MKLSLVLCGLLLVVAAVSCAPVPSSDDLSPLNEKKVKVRSSTPKVRTTTEEDIPEFNRNKVSLDIPPQAFGSGFTIITNISKIISSLIMNSAKRTARIAEIFKPLFRGALSIKGLPTDNEI